ncbi:hypothetical protein [Sandaracinus amylolyticus]|uniref:Tetratricopeptide repeat protein n=1 Tax=Sandaracinus amylolyticus TaxID=927083 RepID=A0A0F6YGM8_9BACT|nr:hypothetical protein [Sandaracinus amylolyticus]AKF03035.1 hypothetical protein DB32_000184 [Sandaracinus amylolyticus]
MLGASLVALVVLVVASSAAAQGASAGRDAYLAADFPGAARAFEQVLARESVPRADALEAHRHLATLRFVLGDAAAAEGHARAAIALAPDALPVEGSPIEISTLFDAARAQLGGRDALRLEHAEHDDGTRSIDATLAPWPSALSATLSLACSAATREGTWRTRARPPRVDLALPALRDDVTCRAELAPAAGGDAWITTELLVPGIALAPPARAPEDEGNDDALIAGLVGGGAAIVVAAVIVAIVLAVDAGSQDARFGGTVSVPGW